MNQVLCFLVFLSVFETTQAQSGCKWRKLKSFKAGGGFRRIMVSDIDECKAECWKDKDWCRGLDWAPDSWFGKCFLHSEETIDDLKPDSETDHYSYKCDCRWKIKPTNIVEGDQLFFPANEYECGLQCVLEDCFGFDWAIGSYLGSCYLHHTPYVDLGVRPNSSAVYYDYACGCKWKTTENIKPLRYSLKSISSSFSDCKRLCGLSAYCQNGIQWSPLLGPRAKAGYCYFYDPSGVKDGSGWLMEQHICLI